MKPSKSLYLIAILPPKEILKEIQVFKEEIKSEFPVSHALKLPAHITLQRPFWIVDKNENKLIDSLSNFSKKQIPFSVELNSFDTFSPRVIFVKVFNHQPLIDLQKRLKNILPVEMFLSPVQQQKEIHPHITLATRDLKKELFFEIWKKFESRKYDNLFMVNSITLFKHDEKKWHLFRDFVFSS